MCQHAHPPTATGFAIAGVAPERFLTPESEIFLGEIGIAEFRQPGSSECADVVGAKAVNHLAIFMANHGVSTWGKHIEMAYWRLENLETLCANQLVARTLKGDKAIPQITGEVAERFVNINAGFLKS